MTISSRLAAALVAASALVLGATAPAVGEVPPVQITKVHEAYSISTAQRGQTYLDKTFYVPFRPDYLGFTSRRDATAAVSIDDVVEVTVWGKESPAKKFTWDYSRNCSGKVSSELGQDITSMLPKEGGASVRVKFINKCGGSAGSSAVYLEGARMTQVAGDRSDVYDDLRLPPGRSVKTEVNPLFGILGIPGVGFIDVAGPLLVDGRVVSNARIETRNYVAGFDYGARQVLAEAQCGKCSYSEVASNLVGHLPSTGLVTTEPLSAPLKPGRYYRLEVKIYAPQLDRNYKQTSTEASYQDGTYTSSAVRIGGLN